jgi:hypothetical protein
MANNFTAITYTPIIYSSNQELLNGTIQFTSAVPAANLTTVQISELTPQAGMLAYNTDTSQLQVYQNNAWLNISNTTAGLQLSGGTMTGPLILNADPTTPLGAATKQYVDAYIQGLTFKNSCDLATTSALTATYNNGVSGDGATLTNSGTLTALVIDSVTVNVGDRILVKNQTSASQNGVYVVTVTGNGSTAWILTRAADFNTPVEMLSGSLFAITSGTVNALTSYVCTADVTTVGTNIVEFMRFSAGGSVIEVNTGSGLTGGPISTYGTISLEQIEDDQFTYTNPSSVSVDEFGRVINVESGDAPITSINGTNGRITANTSNQSTQIDLQIIDENLGNTYAYPSSIAVDDYGRINSITAGSTPTLGTVTQVNAGTGLTGGPITNTGTISLTNTGVTAAQYQNATVTVDEQGRITAASNNPNPVTSVTGSSNIAVTGGLTPTLNLTTTGVTAQSYTNATVGVDIYGRITSASSGTAPVTSVSGTSGQIAIVGTTTPTVSLIDTAVNAGSYTNASITVDTKGRLTSANSGTAPVTTISGTSGQIAVSGTTTPTISLVNTTVTAGSYSNANITVDAQGRITNASAGTNGTVTSVSAGTGLTGGTITSTGTINLANTAVTPGSYTNSSIQVDQQGRITAAFNGDAPITSIFGAADRIVISGTHAAPTIDLDQSGVDEGSYTNASITVDEYGRVTNASSGTAPVTSVSATSGQITVTGTTTPTIGLANAGTAGTTAYPSSITTDAYGRVMSTSSGVAPVTSVTGTDNQITINGTTTPTIAISNNPVINGTGGITVPRGTSEQRAGGIGTIRLNTDTSNFEGTKDGSTWVSLDTSSGTVTQVNTGTGLTGGPITNTGTISLATAGTSGTYNYPASITTDAYGRVTGSTSGVQPLPLAGGTLTGMLTLDSDPINDLDAATKSYVDAATEAVSDDVTTLQTAIESRLDTDEANIITLTSGLSSTNTTVSGINTRLTTAETNISTVTSGLATTNTTVSGINTRLGTAETNITTLTSDISAIESRLDTNETDITNLTNGLSSANTDITTIQNNYLSKAGNLSGIASAETARTNLGLTGLAIATTTQYAVQVGAPSNGLTSLGLGTTGQVLTSGGNSANPTWSDLPDAVTSVTAGTGLTGGEITSTGTISLADTDVTAGSYTNAAITVDAQGRLTAASSGTAPVTTVSGTNGQITSSGGTTPTLALATVGTAQSSITNATVTTDAFGRVTALSQGTSPVTSVSGENGQVTVSGTTTPTISLADTSVTAGEYTNASITVDSKGFWHCSSNFSYGN